jgi:membrane-bound metal-dependent hydrolase YbcI (DUF457 family)
LFLLGHLALGYLLGKFTAKKLKEFVILPILFVLSVAPDIDFFIGLPHHGPTHSIVVIFLIFLPFFLKYRKKALPYFIALAQHLLGDLFEIGGLMLFWPISSVWFVQANEFGRRIFTFFGYPLYSDYIRFDILLELICFLVALVFLLRGDLRTLLNGDFYNLALIIPAAGIFISSFIAANSPIEITLAQTVFLLIFCLSILKACIQVINRKSGFYGRKTN